MRRHLHHITSFFKLEGMRFTPSNMTALASEAARAAGEILHRGFGTQYAISAKDGKNNLVTEYDKRSEACIIDMILQSYPEHNIIAEESGIHKKTENPHTWIIDPLDGTMNFAHNVPFFAVSIAVTQGDALLSAVVFNPLLNELYIAEKGKGAFLNGRPICVSSVTHLHKALLATGFPYNVDKNPRHCIEQFTHLQAQGIPIRRFGAAALDLCFVAAGRFDGFWEVTLAPWDMAAGKLIVEEAGGTISHYDGTPHTILDQDETLVATNGALHPALLQHLNLMR